MSSIHKSLAKLGFFKTFIPINCLLYSCLKDHLGDQFKFNLAFSICRFNFFDSYRSLFD